MSYNIESWESELKKSDFTTIEVKEKMIYVRRAFEHKVPVILDIQHLALLLGIRVGVLSNMIHKPSAFYRKFQIPKKRGGLREIVTPYNSLLEVQQWIVKNILYRFEVHPAAYAYVKNKNIAKNAAKHIGSTEMLKMDLKDFFPSISFPRVRELFNRIGYNKDVAFYLTSLCCLNDSIPQGAGSSPAISNIVLYSLDKRLTNFSESKKTVYTRYADDLFFSGKSISDEFRDLIAQNILDAGFIVNTEKTIFYNAQQRKLATGVVVKKNSIRLPKKKRREIEQEVYFILKYGIRDQIELKNDVFYIDRVLGRLSFWKQIEPKNDYVNSSIRKIKSDYSDFLSKI